jgi:hypothetical protein
MKQLKKLTDSVDQQMRKTMLNMAANQSFQNTSPYRFFWLKM